MPNFRRAAATTRSRRQRVDGPDRKSGNSCFSRYRRMRHRGHSEFRGHPYGHDPCGREAQDRVRTAQVAARLIAEHGISDWSLAKRKAVRELMLPDRAALPGDDEIESALVDYHALFGGSEHLAQLRAQREEALRWMQRLAPFEPTLAGGVAAGWATAHSDILIDLVHANVK